MRHRGIPGVVVMTGLLLGACASAETTSSQRSESTAATSGPSEGGAGGGTTPSNGSAASADPGSAGGDGTYRAVITIGDERFEVVGTDPQTSGCAINDDGVFGAGVTAADLLTIVTVHLPPDGYVVEDLFWEQALPYVEITLADGREWRANGNLSTVPPAGGSADLEEGLSMVDSFTFDASSASGTATFVEWSSVTVDPFAPVSADSVAGTFELTCG